MEGDAETSSTRQFVNELNLYLNGKYSSLGNEK